MYVAIKSKPTNNDNYNFRKIFHGLKIKLFYHILFSF